MKRRTFLKRSVVTTAGLTGADFLRYFLNFGVPDSSKAFAMAAAKAREGERPRFLIYWFLEGGWMGYDMFNPVETPNNVIARLPNVSDERYRVLKWGQDGYNIKRHGNIRFGYLAEPGKGLFRDLAVLSSMETGSFHSGDRLKAHMGSYKLRLQDDRQEDERSVMQAFAEACGQSYVLPNLSWHWWLSDGELNEVQYTGRKGYYHALGPVHAHTIYAGTPQKLKQLLLRMQAESTSAVNRQIESFLDNIHHHLLHDGDLEVVRSYHSARQIYENLAKAGLRLDRGLLSRLFTDAETRERFQIKPEDELISYQSVNGNKARTKFAPNTNVQAMMTYELMRAGLSCGFWIESRDIRRFDSHYNRRALWDEDGRTPRGQPDQTQMMKQNLWDPFNVLVDLLKKTPCGTNRGPSPNPASGTPPPIGPPMEDETGESLFDRATIVLTSEFGRTIHGDVDAIKAMPIPEPEKKKMIDGQDISQHWKVTSAAFLGGSVRGDRQFGGIGEKTLMAIPILPDGSLDPAFDPVTGVQLPGRTPSPQSRVPDHGDVYATALYLSGVDPKGRGHNERPPLTFIKKA